MKFFYCSLIFSFFLQSVFAQKDVVFIKGTVVNEQNKTLDAAGIKIIESGLQGVTDRDGKFNLVLRGISKSSITIEFSYIGFQKQIRVLKLLDERIDMGKIVLQESNLSLKTIEINSKRNFEGSSNSSLIINRDIIERVPALSLADLLNQLPNRKITAPSLQNVQNITLRSTFEPTTNNRGAFEMNNAYGVAIILDGNAISNNMNMQSFNPGGLGSSNSFLSTGNGYGLDGAQTKSYSGDFAFGGIDLRQIPVDNIERLEVISGVPSARYGDLSEGAIILDRQAGRAPAYLRMQLRNNATSYGYSQGFKLSPKLGALNISANYVNSYEDNRDKLKAYKRVTGSAIHTIYLTKDKRLKNTLSLDYGRNLDGLKQDPDAIDDAAARFDSWNASISNRSSFQLNGKFIKDVSLNLRYSEGHQVSYREQFRNEPYTVISNATSTGIHEGYYVKGIFTAISLIDGRPVNTTAKLDFTGGFKLLNVANFIQFGLSYDYGVNKGLGQVLDPSRPRIGSSVSATSLSSNRSERYYDFNLAVPQRNLGLYLEDSFTFGFLNRDLNVRAGVRYDRQNSWPSFSPRLNANYALTDKFKLGLAYGLSFKSPSLAQLYPGPAYYEIPLINAYNGNAAESTYLAYVNRFDPESKHIKSIKSEILELSSQLKTAIFDLSLSLYNKKSRNGISTVQNFQFLRVPTYQATMRSGEKPMLTQTGERIARFSYYTFANSLSSDNQGIELMASSRTVKSISTSFNISGGIYRTAYRSSQNSYESVNEESGNANPDYAVIGVYPPKNYVSYLSNGRITSTTHVPKASLMISFTIDLALMQKTIHNASAGIPIAYYTRDGRYMTIQNFDSNDKNYSHLLKPQSELNADNVPNVVPNFHLNVAKDIKKRLNLSFNVFNVFNYQPYYIDSTGSYHYPNSAPNFGASLSFKL